MYVLYPVIWKLLRTGPLKVFYAEAYTEREKQQLPASVPVRSASPKSTLPEGKTAL